MKLKHTLVLAALTIAFCGAIPARASDENPAKDAKAEKAQPAQRDRHHDRADHDKQQSTGKAKYRCCSKPSQPDEKPVHSHGGHKM